MITLKSNAFENSKSLPSKFTCDGEDLSPPLSIKGVGSDAKSLVLIMDDPDAPVGTWDHWIVFNISPQITEIKEGSGPEGVFGINSWGKIGYGGPCPPNGEHKYFFKLYELDTVLDLLEGSSKKEIENAMNGHILSNTELVGLYNRK